MIETKGNYKHGHCIKGGMSKEYTTYKNMINRCYRKKDSCFHNYGGRGITVCERWLGENGFKNFLQDMGKKPNHLTLERINNNEGYCPKN